MQKVAIQADWNITILPLIFRFHGLRKLCGKKNGSSKIWILQTPTDKFRDAHFLFYTLVAWEMYIMCFKFS